LLGTGTGSFGAAINYSVDYTPWGITSADFNGDGKPDLAVANSGGNDVSVLLGTGTGSFNTATNYSVGNFPEILTSADFNGDGKADLAVANYGLSGGANISVLLGTGTGSFGAAASYPAGTNNSAIASSDLNGDGKADLAVLDFGGGSTYILRGSGTGSFSTVTNFATGAGSSLISTDLNGDGKPDLAVSNYNVSIPVFLNVPPPTITASGNNSIFCVGELVTLTASGASSYDWNINSIQTPSAYSAGNHTTFIASNDVIYTVAGLAVTGCSASTTIQVSVSACTGINLTEGQETIRVFPNPAKNAITVDAPFEEDLTLEIFNQLGQLILRRKNFSNHQSLDISALETAIYFYRITCQDHLYSGKFYKIN
jgi:hypothetical protein